MAFGNLFIAGALAVFDIVKEYFTLLMRHFKKVQPENSTIDAAGTAIKYCWCETNMVDSSLILS